MIYMRIFQSFRVSLFLLCVITSAVFAAAPERFDERAGLVTRLAPNIARVNAALAVTVPTGQGRRMIERIEVM